MFPDMLDGAEVLYYTPKYEYGKIYYDTGEIAYYVNYLAICKYKNCKNNEYYLFTCDENYEVASDEVWDSIEQCMCIANSSYGNIIWISKE